MNWIHIGPIVISAGSLVLSGLTIKWSRDARRYGERARRSWERVIELGAETERLRAARTQQDL